MNVFGATLTQSLPHRPFSLFVLQRARDEEVVTSAWMEDVWVHVICRELEPRDLVCLSMVNKWGYNVAHKATQHRGVAWMKHAAHYKHIHTHWPSLKLHVRPSKMDELTTITQMSQVSSLDVSGAFP
jgi:hypothetical protein